MRKVALFVEDFAHEAFLRAMDLRRLESTDESLGRPLKDLRVLFKTWEQV